MPHIATHQLDCYIVVQGQASESSDAGLPGVYLVQVETSLPVDQTTLTAMQAHHIAHAALNAFHEKQGIEVLDDFNIAVHLSDGAEISEDASLCDDARFFAWATFSGAIAVDEQPERVAALTTCIDSGGYRSAAANPGPQVESTLVGQAIVLNVPAVFGDGAFVAWLNDGQRKLTWHTGGQPTEESDLVVLLDPGLEGEGSDSDMPEHVWKLIIAECRKHLRPSANVPHVLVRLTNLPI